MNWIALSLLAPLFWAASNFIDKYILGKYTKSIYDFVFFSTITGWLFFVAILFFTGIPNLTAYSLIPIGTGMLLMYSYGFYGKALEDDETSSLVILFTLVPVITIVLGYIFLGQKLGANELIGFLVVLAGAMITNHSGSIKKKGLWMILVTIVMWSVMTVLIDFGLTKMSFWDYFLLDNLGSSLAGVVLLLIPRIKDEVVQGIQTATVKKYIWFLWNNLLDFFGQMSIKMALVVAPSVGLVTVLMQAQAFYAILIGIFLTIFLPRVIKEEISFPILLKKFLGAGIMILGIYIIVM